MEKFIVEMNGVLNSIVWGPVMLVLMVGIGIYFTLRTRFFQISKVGQIWKNTFGSLTKGSKDRKAGAISPFQATATALAGTMGTGNIVGVATALVSGGPGAIFWMWISAFFGMMTKYAEIVLAIKFRTKNDSGEFMGGPMYYIEKGLGQKWLAVLFAIFCACASFGIGNMTQVNSISQSLKSTWNINTVVTGIVVAVFVAFVLLGGVSRIAKVTSTIVPFLAIFYILGSIVALAVNSSAIPDAFALIFEEAFSMKSVGGGVLGYAFMNAIKFGFSRGVFSNEAGLGSAPIAHAASDAKSPVKQGMWGIFEVFADTIVVCTMTALVILTSGVLDSGLDGADLTMSAFSQSLGGFTDIFLCVSITLFAFSTIVGWSYYGEQCINYLFKRKMAVQVYRYLFVLALVVGASMKLEMVWSIGDTLNGLMAIPNLIALVGLSGVVVALTRDYRRDLKLKGE